MVSYYASQTVFLFNLPINTLPWLNILLAIQCFGRLCQSPRHGYSRKLHVWLHGIYAPWFMTAVLLTYTPTGQALTKVFRNSNLVNIICLPYCHSIFMIKKFISPAKEEILAPRSSRLDPNLQLNPQCPLGPQINVSVCLIFPRLPSALLGLMHES